MLIAWSDHDGLAMNQLLAIPLNNAFAPFWCFILHLYCEFPLFLAAFEGFHDFWCLKLK